MNAELILQFLSPPVPYFIYCDKAHFSKGFSHLSRYAIGVFDLIVVARGELHIGEEKNQWRIKEGQSLILRPDLYHYAVEPCRQETDFYWVHFQTSGKWEEKEGNLNAQLQSSFLEKNSKDDEEIMFKTSNYYIHLPKFLTLTYPESMYMKLEQLVELKDKPLAVDQWKQQNLFEELLKELFQYHLHTQNPKSVVLAENVVGYIKQNYHQPISNDQLQTIFHYHPNYISRSMQKVFGCTPIEYLNKYRLEQARLLLVQTSWNVAKIAEETGFVQTPYFTRQFKKYTGLSPTQFRKKFFTKNKEG